MMGVSNMIVACSGGVPVSHSFKVLIVMQGSGARSKLWSLLVGVSFSMFYFVSDIRLWISVIPKCSFGGLVASLGIEFIAGSLAESRERIGSSEWRLVLVTAIATYF